MNSSNESTDFYSKVFEVNPFHICAVLISILCLIICPFFLYYIIWYERYGSDQKRTLINRFTSMSCWAIIQFIVIVHAIETARFTFGPLPAAICHLQNIVRYSILDMIMINQNAAISTKYMFIIWLKNPAGFNDEFWAFFAWMWIQGYSYFVEITIYLLGSNQPVTFYICCGTVRTTTTEQNKPIFSHNAGTN